MSFKTRVFFAACLALGAVPAAAQSVTFRLTKQLDMASLGAGVPASVAAYGNQLYIGSLSGSGNLYRIQDPLGTPTMAVTFGGLNDPATNGGLATAGTTTNGYLNLFTDGVTLIASTNNGGDYPDIAQSYQFGSEILNWGANSGFGSLDTQTGALDGAAVDPISGYVMTVAWSGDKQNFFEPNLAAPAYVEAANILYYDPGVKTGWRDVSYDHATGDIYLRADGGVARGERVATGRFVTLDGTTAGVQTIVALTNPLTSAINVEYLPSSFAGQELVIINDRQVRGTTFDGIVKTFSATPPTSAPTSRSPGGVATNTPVAASFVLADGVTPFTTTDANSGIYDFSYDPVNNQLYVSDYSMSLVHVFGTLAPGITIDVPSGVQTQAEAGYPTIGSAPSVTKIGAGTVVFDSANAYTGPTTIAAGTLEVANSAALEGTAVTVDTGATLSIASGTTMKAPAVIVDGGTLSAATVAVNSATGITSLAINAGTIVGSPVVNIGPGGQMSLVQDARVTVAIGGLSVDQATGGGRLDLGAGQVSIAAGGISAADLRADIIAGRNSGAWNGSAGITSSAAAVTTGRAVGYVVNGDGSAQVSFAASGDVDLSGQVNVFDLVGINSAGRYGAGPSSNWSQGDFNYDGVTNVFDLVAVNTAGVYGQGNYFPSAPSVNAAAGSVAAVPEPVITGWLLGSAASFMLRLRRRR